MSVDLRRTDIGVAQKLLDSPEIGTSLEKMSRIGVPKGVRVQGAAVGEGIPGEHPPGVAGRHPVSSGIDEERAGRFPEQLRPGAPEIGGYRVARRGAQRQAPDFCALAQHRDRRPAQVDGLDIEAATLAHAQPGAVQELEERGITPRAWIVGVGRRDTVEHRERIVAARNPRQLLRSAGGVKPGRNVA
jgi:hypothetical protein